MYILFFNPEVCRGLMRINLLLYCYVLEIPYIKFIHILMILNKMNKKILCFLYFAYVIKKGVNQQETLTNSIWGMTMSDKGSSETIRSITYNFNSYFSLLPLHKKKMNKKFLHWFIGFSEGAGSFIILNNKIYFGIKLCLLNIQTLYYIKKELGFGKVMFKMEGKTKIGIFYISGKDNFERLIAIFNGNLSTNSKKEKFKNWLFIFNQQYKMDIKFKNNIVKPSLSNGWMCGFTDALGCFYGIVNKYKKLSNKTPYLTFSIVNDELYIIKVIRDIFLRAQKENLDSVNIKYDKLRGGWAFNCSNISKLKVIRRYFSIYKLKTTSKSLAFKNWCKIHNLVLNKDHLTKDGLNKIDLLTKKINKFLS
uniref:Homing endonuclease LAGLIDADG domain-containing protein n=1 Tax=Dactylella tenuis TaxID=383872 RepID=A0A4Y5MX45_9PEZI|nr:hypothetical protein [Dactylella tenuis]QCW06851.1 hypothetical protein [Dactylella tenuis]